MKKKKHGGNSKIFSTIILVFVVCCFMATNSWAARKVDITMANASGFIGQLNQNGVDLGPVFGLSADEGFQLLRQITDFNGVTHYRYQQTYKGIPVWGIQTLVGKESSNNVKTLHGSFIQGNPGDVGSIPASLDSRGKLMQMQELHKAKDPGAIWNFRNEQAETYVYFHKKSDKARLCYVVSFFADTDCGNPSRPIFFIDAKNGKIIDSFDSLAYAFDGTGPGGNLKVGYYYYGTDYPKFGVAINGSTCTMNYADCKTVDLNHGTSGTTPFSYTCYNNTHESINGAWCPLNDAQYFGQAVFDMYQAWYGLPALPFQLTLRCHYSNNYEGHFWNGSTVTFGDGYTTYYPLVALDLIAHEASHGFTENNSGLSYPSYSGQSGGINESFSDMAGEAAKYYVRGANDFRFCYDILKDPDGAERYLYNPPLDGHSIDHVCEYYEGMDVHYSSGIFNKAFYLIATTPGWTTKRAFDIFVKANTDYWTPDANFQQGAEGALDAASDYGYSCKDVAYAFASVGITLTCPVPIYCSSSGCSQEYEYIAGVQVGDLNNPSGPSHYSDFTNMTAHLTQGETVDVELTPGFPNRPYVECWKIWIDYNMDCDFEDEGEEVFSGSGSSVVTGSFTVPCSNIGDTRMRVSMSYSTCPPVCGTFPSGEVEDYTANIACQVPVANFTASPTNPSVGGSVNFTDTSTNCPTSWYWTFEGGTPATSTAKNPTVTYNTLGWFDVTLTATNSCGSDSETKTDYIKCYCHSQGNSQAYEWISRVRVANLDNSSGASPYSDFTSNTADLTRGTGASVILNTEYSGTIYTEYWRIWIDYNRDGDFDDTGEQVFSKYNKTSVSGSFTPPTSALVGATRMRVSMKYGSYPTSCETFSYGEVEDYTANIQ
jgi:vibriolysin